MHQLNRWFLILLVGISHTGCMSIYKVHDETEKKLPGIPFYTKTAICRQTTVYHEPFVEISIVKLDANVNTEGKPEVVETLLAQNAVSSTTAQQFRNQVNGTSVTEGELAQLRSLLAQSFVSCFGNLQCPATSLASQNLVAREVVVNYGQPRYYNVKRPWVGTADATVELNEDGTLSKATAKIEDKTLETILNALPITEFLSKELGLVAPPSAEETLTVAANSFRIRIDYLPKTLVHTLSRENLLDSTLCTPKAPLTAQDWTAGISSKVSEVVLLAAAKPTAAKKEDDKQPKITISGEIALPKTGG